MLKKYKDLNVKYQNLKEKYVEAKEENENLKSLIERMRYNSNNSIYINIDIWEKDDRKERLKKRRS